MNQVANQGLVVIEGQATYERIVSYMREVETEEAIRQIQNFIKIYPEFAQAHNDLAVLYYQTGNGMKALAHYEKAHKLDPTNITYRKNLADFYFFELEWADDAIRAYMDILNDAPYDIETLNALGSISQQTGRNKQARHYFEQTLNIDPSNSTAQQAMQQLGTQVSTQYRMARMSSPVLQLQETPKASLAELSAANYIQGFTTPSGPQKPQQTPEQLYQHALDLAQSGKTSDARKALEELVFSHPNFAVAHNDLGVLYQQEGDNTRSRFHHEEAVRLQPDNLNFQKNLADLLYIAFSETEEAMKLYVKILGDNPRDIDVLKAISHICLENGKLDDARSFLESILIIEPWNSVARESLTNIANVGMTQQVTPAAHPSADEIHAEVQKFVLHDRLSEAQAMLEELVHHYPDHAIGHNDLGVLRYRLGDIEGARRAYEQAVELQPTNSNFRKNLADLYFAELGMVDDAIGIYLDLFRLTPRDVETLTSLGHICASVGRPEEAKTFYRRVLEIEPWNAESKAALLGQP
ncbi:MAG: tetratricopeptide repeat protein [Desulfuromonadales bacterium]|nr:tetratricopeptide repeat protein [Desulfuromonadales bacterium]